MARSNRSVAWLSGLILASPLVGCGGGSSSHSEITVTVAPDSKTVQAGGTVDLNATVQSDASTQGVTWTISPSSGAGTLSDKSPTSVRYDAPANSPASDMAVTITATSRDDISKSDSASITVSAVEVQITPSEAQVDATGTVTLTASVRNDPAQAGVNWTISPVSGAGELSDASGTSVVYHAPPGPPPSDLTVTITATPVAEQAISASATITVPAIVLAIEPVGATVVAGSNLLLTASLLHDPSQGQADVTWAISPDSGAGSLANVTSASVTYEAPPSPPHENLDVVITATSRTDHSLSGSAYIMVPAIAIQVAPDSALIPANATQQFVATIENDPGNQGAGWTLTQGSNSCSPDCGSLEGIDPVSTAFKAPSAMPADSRVTLTATSLADPGKSVTATLELSNGTVQLAPMALDFGTIKTTQSRTKRTTLTNAGSGVLAISRIKLEGPDTDQFSEHHDCDSSVGPGASCRIDVTFSPRTDGEFFASLTIADGSADSPQEVALSGSACLLCGSIPAVKADLVKHPTLVAPGPTGRESVGTRTFDLIDPARDDPYRNDGTRRELLVRFWYPASVSHGCKPAPYAAPAVWKYESELARQSLPVVKTNSCLDARAKDGAYPVVVFTHGYTGTFTDYTFLFEDLASRGYIVASIGHTYESTGVSFPDGRFAKSVLGSYLSTARLNLRALARVESVRLADVRFVIDELARINTDRDSPLADHLDVGSVAVAGHSLGGLTALEAAGQDPRIRAAVVVDGIMPGKSFEPTLTPVLLIDAGSEQWSPDKLRLWDKLHGQRYALNLQGAEHVAPSDLAWLAGSAIDTGRMTREQTVAATRDTVAAFLDASVRGKPVDSLLTRRTPRFPGLEVTEPTP